MENSPTTGSFPSLHPFRKTGLNNTRPSPRVRHSAGSRPLAGSNGRPQAVSRGSRSRRPSPQRGEGIMQCQTLLTVLSEIDKSQLAIGSQAGGTSALQLYRGRPARLRSRLRTNVYRSRTIQLKTFNLTPKRQPEMSTRISNISHPARFPPRRRSASLLFSHRAASGRRHRR